MKKMPLFNIPWTAAYLILVIAGCGQKLYRAETTVYSDGSLDRAIYQLREELPAEALAPRHWQGMTYAAEIGPDKWDGTIARLPNLPFDSRHAPYIAVWGHFDATHRLPQHFVMKSPPGLPEGRLVVDYQRHDYILVVEHSWRETLTDIVTLHDIHAACDQLVDLVIEVGSQSLQQALENDYDIRNLTQWVQTEGRTWFRELVDTFYEAAARSELRNKESDARLTRELAMICARHGLDLQEDGQLLDSEKYNQRIEQFVRQLLQRTVRRKDGRPIDEENVSAVLSVRISPLAEPSNGQPPKDESPTPLQSAIESAIFRTVQARFGGEKEFEQRLLVLCTRILGLYHVELLGPPRRFHYSVILPGFITETNGRLTSGYESVWSFEAKDAYPFGFAMKCRSVVPQGDIQKQILSSQPLRDLNALSAYVSLMQDDANLLEAIRTCANQRSLQPLHAYQKVLANETSSEAYKRSEKLFKLLKISSS